MVGFLTGTGANLLSVPTGGMSRAAHGAAYKANREKLKSEILILSDRLAKLRNGDVEQAKKDGIKVRKEDLPELDKVQVAKSAALGLILPFYGTYQGHKHEELQKELAAKVTELKIEFAQHGLEA